MTDSYHFASVPQFRVGGVYRSADGRVVRIAHVVTDETCAFYKGATAVLVEAFGGEMGWYGTGWRRLEDGQYHERNFAVADLIPGELHQVNGEWVPVEQKLSFPSGSVLTTSGDKIVGREEPTKPRRSILDIEPIRPALTWRTKTEFDPFKGFVVRGTDTSQPRRDGFASPDLQATSPFSGSAYLLPKTA